MSPCVVFMFGTLPHAEGGRILLVNLRAGVTTLTLVPGGDGTFFIPNACELALPIALVG